MLSEDEGIKYNTVDETKTIYINKVKKVKLHNDENVTKNISYIK